MRRVRIIVETYMFYANPPTTILREGVDYIFDRDGSVSLMCYGLRCFDRVNVEVARKLRRQALIDRKPRGCRCGHIPPSDNLAGVECTSAGFNPSTEPLVTELITLAYLAYLIALVDKGRLDMRRLARELETGSCRVVVGSWWKLLEDIVGRRALRMSTGMLVSSEFRQAFASLVPSSQGRHAIRRARCFFGGIGKASYILELPEEVADTDNFRLLAEVTCEASKRLRDELEITAFAPPGSGYVKLGVGSWPLSTLPGLAAYSGLVSRSIAEAFFRAFRRCGATRTWPPRSIDVIVAPDGKAYEAGWVRIDVSVIE